MAECTQEIALSFFKNDLKLAMGCLPAMSCSAAMASSTYICGATKMHNLPSVWSWWAVHRISAEWSLSGWRSDWWSSSSHHPGRLLTRSGHRCQGRCPIQTNLKAPTDIVCKDTRNRTDVRTMLNCFENDEHQYVCVRVHIYGTSTLASVCVCTYSTVPAL